MRSESGPGSVGKGLGQREGKAEVRSPEPDSVERLLILYSYLWGMRGRFNRDTSVMGHFRVLQHATREVSCVRFEQRMGFMCQDE